MKEVPDLKTKGFVPELSLTSNRDRWWNIRNHLRRRNIVVYFVHDKYCDKCRARLKAFARDYADWRRIYGEVVAVFSDPVDDLKNLGEELDLPFPLLSDADGRAKAAFSLKGITRPDAPVVFVVDRLSTLFYHELNDAADPWLEAAEVFEEVEFLEGRCPECGIYG